MTAFPNLHHKFETIYPDSSTRVQFGKSYVFTAPPTAPDQRTFRLSFTGMRYYTVDDQGLVIDTDPTKLNNLAVLDNFYQSVRLYGIFTYTHPIYGPLACRFSKPLQIPKGLPNGNGVVEDFTVELMEQP